MLVAVCVLAATARAELIAVDPLGAAVPVLWDGGVAWQDEDGVLAASPGATPHRLVSFKSLGYLHRFALDAGAESEASAAAAGPLAFGWEEANETTPPMGPGDQRVPSPALPYETSIVHRGVVAADGQVTTLGGCGPEGEGEFLDYRVSLSGSSVAYNCQGVPPGVKPEREAQPSYMVLGDLAAAGAAPRTIDAVQARFQVSGDYLAYVLDEGYGSAHMVVEDPVAASSYEAPKTLVEGLSSFALGSEGALVLVGAQGGAGCPDDSSSTVWLSPSSPVAHTLGCFYSGSLRVVGGQWVGLAPGPGSQASLELVTLASGATRALATLANPGMLGAAQGVQAADADFDGKQLAWTTITCAGTAVEYAPEVGAMSPSAPGSAVCPLHFVTHGVLRANARGIVHVAVSCPLGCPFVQLSLAKPSALATPGALLFRAAPSTTLRESLRLSKRQLRYLRRHRRVSATLVALSQGLGTARESKYAARVTLAG